MTDFDINTDLKATMRLSIRDMEADLSEAELQATYGLLMRSLVDDERWKKIVSDLRDREAKTIDQLLQPNLSPQQFGRLQGYIRALRILIRTPILGDEAMSELEEQTRHLREQIASFRKVIGEAAM